MTTIEKIQQKADILAVHGDGWASDIGAEIRTLCDQAIAEQKQVDSPKALAMPEDGEKSK